MHYEMNNIEVIPSRSHHPAPHFSVSVFSITVTELVLILPFPTTSFSPIFGLFSLSETDCRHQCYVQAREKDGSVQDEEEQEAEHAN